MITENEARELLASAAATIEVDERAEMTLTGLPEPRQRRTWPGLLAAAAMVALIAGVTWAVTRDADTAQSPALDRGPVAETPPPEQTMPPEEESVVDPARAATAESFVDWARGDGLAPAFADRVRLMMGGGALAFAPPWVAEPEHRNRWSGCSGLGFPDCGLDPVAVVYHSAGPIEVRPGRCSEEGTPARFAKASQDVVRLQQPPPTLADDAWAVELWIDTTGVIYAVNLAWCESPG